MFNFGHFYQSKGACIEQLSGSVIDLRKSFVEICMCP